MVTTRCVASRFSLACQRWRTMTAPRDSLPVGQRANLARRGMQESNYLQPTSAKPRKGRAQSRAVEEYASGKTHIRHRGGGSGSRRRLMSPAESDQSRAVSGEPARAHGRFKGSELIALNWPALGWAR